MKKRIVVIDDDHKLNELLTDYLSQFNYTVNSFTHPLDGLNSIKSQPPDLVILDVMLPDINGFDVCKKIRQFSDIPVIMLTARGEVTDRIVGLELGADDYLAKPFEPGELRARIQSVLRRGVPSNREIYHFEGLSIDMKSRSAQLSNNPLELTQMEFDVLSVFIQNPFMVLSRDQLLEHLKGLDWDPDNRSIDVLVSRLRQKLQDDPRQPRCIKTIRGTGYMFIAQEISH